jgi:hypothetical protein|tara:strand:+ start:1196 stop:1942 length:747 start_codon:yes stop_codon:yes gene_type:complete
MFEKTIEFSANEKFIKHNTEYLPVPIKLNIPKWYKELEHTIHNKTVKGCMPFLDTLTSGYLLKMPIDYYLEHNVKNEKGNLDTGSCSGQKRVNNFSDKINLNYDTVKQLHEPDQLKGSPLLEKNKGLSFHKILNPWTIKTPPGYSCLFLPPMNNTDDRFSIIPGIVDTDSFPTEINFPILLNGDKYPSLKTLIKKGTPYVQIFPFKREQWKMQITKITDEKRKEMDFFSFTQILHNYKIKFWSKKSWK